MVKAKATAKKAKTSALRWFVRIVLILVTLTVLAAGAVVVIVHTGWGRDQIRALIVEELQRDFPASTIESVSGSPFGTIVLRGVTLNELDQSALVTIAEARLEVSLLPLVSKRVHIDTLAISGVRVFVREHPPVPEIDAREAPPPPTTFTIEMPAITVTDAQVTIETATGTELIDQIVAHGAARIPTDSPISAGATIAGRWRGKAVNANLLASIGDTVRLQLVTATLGDARVVATGVDLGDYTAIGSVSAFVPAALVRELTEIEVPGDVTVVASGRPGGSISLAATSGSARVGGELVADLVGLTARGIVIVEAPDLGAVTRNKVVGSGTVVTAVNASLGRARGIATIFGEAAGRAGSTTVAFDTWRDGAEVVASATIPLGTLSIYAHVVQRGDRWVLANADVMAHASGVNAPFVIGRTDATFSADGTLSGEPSLAVRGTIVAHGVRFQTAGARRISIGIKGELSPSEQHAALTIRATGISSGATRIPSADVQADVRIVGEDLKLTLGKHTVRTQDGALWAGRGGTVAVTRSEIIIDEIQTGTGTSTITASARIGQLDGSLSAKVAARGVALAIADPTLGGTADADIDVTRRRGQWRGTASVRGHQIAMPGRPVVEATVDAVLAGRKVSLAGSVSNAQVGKITLDAAVTAPHDLTNPAAWQSLPRSAIDHVTLSFDHLDAVPLGGTGTLDGEITIGGTDARGALNVRGVVTEVGVIDADMTLAAGANDSIELHAIAQTPGIPPSTIDASFVLPARPFDPQAWRVLGRRALNSATIKTAVHVDPALLARFGVTAPYDADVSATVVVLPGATGATLVADIKGLTGGRLTSPIDVHLDATSDAAGTRADLRAQSGKLSITAVAKTPHTIAQALAPNTPPMPIEATLTIPETAARDVFGLFGQTEVVAGTLGGTVTVGGTIADPAVRAQLAAKGLAMKTSSVTNQKPQTLDSLVLDARYRRGRVDLVLTGQEGKDRLLKIAAHGDINDPSSLVASIEAANFDIAPLAAFGTGPVRGARGTLNAAIKVKGLEPTTGSIRGKLSIRDFRMPLSPILGTLRRASVDLELTEHSIAATFEGRLGAGGGTVKGKITGDVVGGIPQNAKLDLKLTKVSPIGALQPQIDAVVVGSWVNEGQLWSGNLTISRGKIYVPPELGNELLVVGTPPDMIFIDKQFVAKRVRRPPTRPWLVTKVTLGTTYLDIEDTDFRVRVYARGDLVVEVGDGIGVRGQIYATRGNLDILGRRYRIDRAIVDFDDGTIDPRLDVRVVHDFKNMTLTVDVGGRASKPRPRLSGDPGSYTEGQLLSFLAGAEPSDQSSTAQQSQAAVSGGLAILSGRIGRRINKYLPVKFDALSYEASTASSSQAIRLGVQLSDKSYLVWRQHPAPRADENTGEAVFEYQLRANMVFEATVGERSQGGDFLWRKRW